MCGCLFLLGEIDKERVGEQFRAHWPIGFNLLVGPKVFVECGLLACHHVANIKDFYECTLFSSMSFLDIV